MLTVLVAKDTIINRIESFQSRPCFQMKEIKQGIWGAVFCEWYTDSNMWEHRGGPSPLETRAGILTTATSAELWKQLE